MDAWSVIGATIASEFGDLGELERTTRVVLRLGLAAMLGALLGYERERKGKAAGLRTHMLVCVGAALFVLPFHDPADSEAASRVVQGIVAGIGFLGAGTILKNRTDEEVQGLTTAASVWFTAAIGVAAGMGREATAVCSAVVAWAVLWLLPALERRWARKDHRGAPRP